MTWRSPRHALKGCDRACMKPGANLFLRDVAKPRQEDTPPTNSS
ncbi:hypothetical protein [Phormidium pseudopriestleyi]|nr:hypothetical protein [Phormidium pseudopriestleyi]